MTILSDAFVIPDSDKNLDILLTYLGVKNIGRARKKLETGTRSMAAPPIETLQRFGKPLSTVGDSGRLRLSFQSMNTTRKPKAASKSTRRATTADSSPFQGDLLAMARQIIASESESLQIIASRLDLNIAEAMRAIFQQTGPDLPGVLVISGLGKSGLAGQRISASFASTGTPSHFLHPVEALHGDLGRVRRQDIALLLSHGGETAELLQLSDQLKSMRVRIISITARATSSLGKMSDLCIEMGPIEEACPLQLAPTTSIACMNAIGDAMVLGVMSLRHFSAEDFAAFHPAGSLGRKLLKVSEVMGFRAGENFIAVDMNRTLREALLKDRSTGRRPGAIVLVDSRGRLAGIFTDGDLRRGIVRDAALLDKPLSTIMTPQPRHIRADALASEAIALLNQHRIDELPVVNKTLQPVGLIDVQDLVPLRIME